MAKAIQSSKCITRLAEGVGKVAKIARHRAKCEHKLHHDEFWIIFETFNDCVSNVCELLKIFNFAHLCDLCKKKNLCGELTIMKKSFCRYKNECKL